MNKAPGIIRWPSERRLMCVLLSGYCLFILYGSFIPFHFSTDPEILRYQLSKIQLFPYQAGVKNFSIPDLMSNLLLFVPFGILMVGAVLQTRSDSVWWRVVVTAGLGLAFGLAVETGQVFTLDRTSSLLDAICNTLGAAAGACLGYFILRSKSNRLAVLVQNVLHERPVVVLLALVALALIADAFYPYEPSLDVSTVWKNLKHAQWIPFQDGSHGFLRHHNVEKVLLLAVLGDLMRRSLAFRGLSSPCVLRAWLFTSLFAAFLEVGKLFFIGRAPNADNFVLGSVGALLGILLVPLLARVPLIRKRPVNAVLGLVLLLIIYAELTPFTWVASWEAIAAKASQIEWLPLASYYMADPKSALFDLGKKMLLICPLGFLLAVRWPSLSLPGRRWMPAAWGSGIGGILEASQLLQVSRIPSMTDVLVFGMAAWMGAVLFACYRTIVASPAPQGNLVNGAERNGISLGHYRHRIRKERVEWFRGTILKGW